MEEENTFNRLEMAKREIEVLKKEMEKLKKIKVEEESKIDGKVKAFAEKLKLLKTNDFAIYHDDVLNAFVLIVVDNDNPDKHLAKFIIKEMDEGLEIDKNHAREIKLKPREIEQMEGLKDDTEKDSRENGVCQEEEEASKT